MENVNVVCTDETCPVHGALRVRGMLRQGIVKSAKAKKTAVVVIDLLTRIPKYDRLKKKRSNIHVHVPACMSVKEGDFVQIAECRKLSKTKAHVVIPKDLAQSF